MQNKLVVSDILHLARYNYCSLSFGILFLSQIEEIAFFFVKFGLFNILDFGSISCIKTAFSSYSLFFSSDCALFGKSLVRIIALITTSQSSVILNIIFALQKRLKIKRSFIIKTNGSLIIVKLASYFQNIKNPVRMHLDF